MGRGSIHLGSQFGIFISSLLVWRRVFLLEACKHGAGLVPVLGLVLVVGTQVFRFRSRQLVFAQTKQCCI